MMLTTATLYESIRYPVVVAEASSAQLRNTDHALKVSSMRPTCENMKWRDGVTSPRQLLKRKEASVISMD